MGTPFSNLSDFKERKKSRGFTLVEIVIVLVIIAILAILALMYFRNQLFKGNDARRKADLDRIKIAAEEYEKDHNCYPPADLMYCNVPPFNGTGLRPYLDKIPCDPVTNVSYLYEYDQSSSCISWYRVYAKLDNPADASIMPLCGGPGGNSFNYYVSSPNAPECVAGTGDGGGTGGGGGSSPTPSGSSGPSGYYGCFSGACRAISWDYGINAPECDPHFTDQNCLGKCLDIDGKPTNECLKLH